MTLQDVIFDLSKVYNDALNSVAVLNNPLQIIVEDVEYEDVSESECEMIEDEKEDK